MRTQNRLKCIHDKVQWPSNKDNLSEYIKPNPKSANHDQDLIPVKTASKYS